MTRLVTLATVGLVLVALAQTIYAAEPELKQKEEFQEAADLEDLENDRAAKLIAYHTTKTKAMFATTTSYALSTCFSVTSTPACTGRKKRNIMVNPDALDERLDSGLSSSLDDTFKPVAAEESSASGRQGKKFTFWNTIFSTYTLTSIEYYPGTTVTVSAICSIAGLGDSCFG